MYITKKHLSRRLVLTGGGAMVALPLLNAMIPASTALAQTAAAPKVRMGYVFFSHGQVMDRWTPAKTGTDFELPSNLAPLKPFQKYLTVVSGLRNMAGETGGPHATKAQSWQNCTLPDTELRTYGVSADQLAAQHIGQGTPMPSLELGTEPASFSFRTPTQRLPTETNPRKMFYKLFGLGDSDAERMAIMQEKGSLLDAVNQRANDLKRELGAEDRLSVDSYLSSVRELERRMLLLEQQSASDVQIPDAPIGLIREVDAHLTIMFDYMLLAYQTNLTNICNMIVSQEVSMRTYPKLGVSEAFHPLSHHQNIPAKLDALSKVQTYHTQKFADFLGKMAKIQVGEGNLLDQSIIHYGSNMSDSNAHNCDPLPNAVIGLGNGKLKGGQHLKYDQDTPHANLVLSLLQRAGVPQEKLGNSTGTLSEL